MKLAFTAHFARSNSKAPRKIQRAFDKQSQLLAQNLLHPSLHAKKYDESRDRWQARVTRDWRFYFTIVEDTCVLLDIMRHPK